MEVLVPNSQKPHTLFGVRSPRLAGKRQAEPHQRTGMRGTYSGRKSETFNNEAQMLACKKCRYRDTGKEGIYSQNWGKAAILAARIQQLASRHISFRRTTGRVCLGIPDAQQGRQDAAEKACRMAQRQDVEKTRSAVKQQGGVCTGRTA